MFFSRCDRNLPNIPWIHSRTEWNKREVGTLWESGLIYFCSFQLCSNKLQCKGLWTLLLNIVTTATAVKDPVVFFVGTFVGTGGDVCFDFIMLCLRYVLWCQKINNLFWKRHGQKSIESFKKSLDSVFFQLLPPIESWNICSIHFTSKVNYSVTFVCSMIYFAL